MYTDANRLPQGSLEKYSIDLELGGDNDFEAQMNVRNHCMSSGCIWYIKDEEYGGIVDNVKVDTEKSKVYYSGRSWRGILEKKVIRPDTGKDYLVVSGDANDILALLIRRCDLVDLFAVPGTSSGIQISNYQFPRYVDAYSGIVKMLSSVGAKLKIVYNDKDSCVNISAVQIEDLSKKYEYSDDYGMKIIIEKKTGGVNHLICLGAGELAARTVIDLYVDKTGEITEKQSYFGEYEIAETYDYGNSESVAELKEKGIEHLKELKSSDSVSASFSKLDVDIGDIVGGRNRATGILLKEQVTQEIVKIKNGIETITYKVGEK
jgi:hypothetical protein